MNCSNCGNPVRDGDVFCMNCGFKLLSDAASSIPEIPVVPEVPAFDAAPAYARQEP